MLDSESPPSSGEVGRTDDYLIPPITATPSLLARIQARIARDGPLPFPEFMAAALYDPTHGYYARGSRQVGRSGDFFTSVSVGPVFGTLLARRFLREWRESGGPARWRIIECGAHDGTLAADLLGSLEQLDARAFATLEYAIAEPLPQLQTAQRQTLQRFSAKVRFLKNPVELVDDPLPGIAFGNEVLDALPCHLIEWQGGRWLEKRVALDNANRLVFDLFEIKNAGLKLALDGLGGGFPDGYRSEIRTGYQDFIAPLAAALGSGLMVWLDYGFERADYYHPGRREGTLRTYSKHRAGEDPLARPGELDLTAHVDFSALAEASQNLGWQPAALCSQGTWLTRIARDWLMDMEGNPQAAALRQFQTLTHPAHLGGAFQVLELTRRVATS
jgi:SAM-dependent MidA family methyltransferase